ncbi:DUF6334 family protein [Microbulbifer aggregans]|uniref:DUF6334 family protein n=1 Tax=Microbulbifer aggregans TaxID=1769779 RepID=UPI0011AB77B4|nr:DUF6334 family protein [Microbulbifer aggregans]
MLKALQDIHDSAGVLRHVVEYQFANELLIALELCFQSRTYFLLADAELDALVITDSWGPDDKNLSSTDVSRNYPWNKVIGQEVLWSWMLTNHQGYSDGMRMEFAGLNSKLALEVIVEASEICVFSASRVIST